MLFYENNRLVAFIRFFANRACFVRIDCAATSATFTITIIANYYAMSGMDEIEALLEDGKKAAAEKASSRNGEEVGLPDLYS